MWDQMDGRNCLVMMLVNCITITTQLPQAQLNKKWWRQLEHDEVTRGYLFKFSLLPKLTFNPLHETGYSSKI